MQMVPVCGQLRFHVHWRSAWIQHVCPLKTIHILRFRIPIREVWHIHEAEAPSGPVQPDVGLHMVTTQASGSMPQTRELISSPNSPPPPPLAKAGAPSGAGEAGGHVSIGQGKTHSNDVKQQMMKGHSAEEEKEQAGLLAQMKKEAGATSGVALLGSGADAGQGAAAVSSGAAAAGESGSVYPAGQQPYPGQKVQFTPSGATLDAAGQRFPPTSIHTLFTSNGSPYQNFQARIMVATWNLVREMPGGENLVAMTRVLHRTTPDEVMDEVS